MDKPINIFLLNNILKIKCLKKGYFDRVNHVLYILLLYFKKLSNP